jgi:hypothetical protein
MKKLSGIKSSVQTAAGVGGASMVAMTADAGNPLINLAVGATVGAGVGLVQGVRNAVRNRRSEFQAGHSGARQDFATQANYANDLGK